MAATTFYSRFKPIQVDNGTKTLNWRWLLQRSPILALGIDSSYNVAKFISLDGTPPVIQIVTGVTFDLIFVGMIALADQFRSESRASKVLFWCINIIAMLVAAVLGSLAYSSGAYVAITHESFTRGAAFPLLGLLYNIYYHTVTGELMADARKQVQLLADREAEDRKELAAKPYECDFCGKRFESIKQRNGHLARCQQKSSTA